MGNCFGKIEASHEEPWSEPHELQPHPAHSKHSRKTQQRKQSGPSATAGPSQKKAKGKAQSANQRQTSQHSYAGKGKYKAKSTAPELYPSSQAGGDPNWNEHVKRVPSPPPQGRRHPELNISHDDLLAGLKAMASHLHGRGAHVTIVVMGGAVNTLFLETRDYTRDVDFFTSDNWATLLKEASKAAQTQSGGVLGPDWFNNGAGRLLRPRIRREAFDAALEQNEILLDDPGMTALVAPWIMCFVAKLQKIAWQPEIVQEYDFADAAHYLQQHIRKSGGMRLTVTEVYQWAAYYEKTIDMDTEGTMRNKTLPRVNKLHQQFYQTDGLMFE